MKCYGLFITFSAFLVPIGFLIGAGFVPCDKEYVGVICITVAVSFMSLRSSGYLANIQDIAARWGILQVVSLQKLILLFHGGQDHSHPFGMPLVLDFWISKFEPVALERDGCGQRSATSRQIFVVMRYWVHEGSSVLIPKKCFCSFFCLFMQKKCINVDRSLWKQHCYRHSEFWTIVFMSKHIINAYGENIVFHLALHFFVSH